LLAHARKHEGTKNTKELIMLMNVASDLPPEDEATVKEGWILVTPYIGT
jgi:hypothetical protein